MITQENAKRYAPRERIMRVLVNTFMQHEVEGRITEVEIYNHKDVHAFYRVDMDGQGLGIGRKIVVHVQAYPGLSNDSQMHVWARLMDYDKLKEIRKYGKVSIGNEHGATIQQFPNFNNGLGTDIPYDSKLLENMISTNVEELQ